MADDTLALLAAIEFRDLAEVQRLVESGVPVSLDDDGWFPLMEAAEQADVEICRYLIERGAKLEDGAGNAACSRSPRAAELVQLFLDHGYPAGKMLHPVAGFSTPEALSVVLAAGVDVNALDDDGETALYQAAKSPEKLALLLQHGANPTLLNTDGSHVLHLCAVWGYVRSLKTLLKFGVPVDVVESEPTTTALHYACRHGRYRCARALLRAGADPNFRDPQSATPLMLACNLGSLALVERLLEHGADWLLLDQEGLTAAEHASKYLPDAEQYHVQCSSHWHDNPSPPRFKRGKNAVGEPKVTLYRGRSSMSWVDCHWEIVNRLTVIQPFVDRLTKGIHSLTAPQRYKQALIARYGLKQFQPLVLREAADKYGVKIDKLRILEGRLLKLIRREMPSEF